MLGESVTLTFNCSFAVTASGSWALNPVPVGGSEIVSPTGTGTVKFTYTCTGEGGSVAAEVTVLVDPVPPLSTRTTLNRPDERLGPKHKYIYMTTNGGIDRGLDTNGVLRNTILASNNWMVDETGWAPWVDEWGGKGEPDIAFMQSTMTASQMGPDGWGGVLQALTLAGFKGPNATYVVFVEAENLAAPTACGEGGGRMAFMWLQRCTILTFATSPTGHRSTWGQIALHEIFHSAGAVGPGAPDFDPAHPLHSVIRCDIMYYTACQDVTIDIEGRSYLGDNVPAGVVNIKLDPYFHFVRPPLPRLLAPRSFDLTGAVPLGRDTRP